MRASLALLFLWMTAMTTGHLIARDEDQCNPSLKGSCGEGEICAQHRGLSKTVVYKCVKAKECEGQSGGECPAGQFCTTLGLTGSEYACVSPRCASTSNGTCKDERLVCVPYESGSGQTFYSCRLPAGCFFEGDHACGYGLVCRNEGSAKHPYFFCVERRCAKGQEARDCLPGEKCIKHNYFVYFCGHKVL